MSIRILGKVVELEARMGLVVGDSLPAEVRWPSYCVLERPFKQFLGEIARGSKEC